MIFCQFPVLQCRTFWLLVFYLYCLSKTVCPSSPMILVRNLSSYNVMAPGLLEWLIQIKSKRDLPTVGPSIRELVLGRGLAMLNPIISSEADMDLALGDTPVSDSSDDILLEKKIKFSFCKWRSVSFFFRFKNLRLLVKNLFREKKTLCV